MANIRIVNNRAIVIKGKRARLFRKPGIANVRRVISRLVNEIVVDTPVKITPTINRSWLPTPVNLVLEENGVIKVQPATVNVLFEHLAI
jgi:hypothetical protein